MVSDNHDPKLRFIFSLVILLCLLTVGLTLAMWERSYLPNKECTVFVALDRDLRLLVAGTDDQGLFVSSNGGATWAQPLDIRRVNSIHYHATEDTVYLCSPEGLYTSSDNGWTWKQRASEETVGDLLGLVFDSKDSKTLWGYSYGNGILCSSDSGANWRTYNQELGAGKESFVVALAQEPEYGDVMLCVVNDLAELSKGTIYRSSNHGNNWSMVDLNYGFILPTAIAFSPVEAGRCVASGFGSGLLESSNYGIHWTKVSLMHEQENISDIAFGLNGETLLAIPKAGILACYDGSATWIVNDKGLSGIQPSFIVISQGRIFVGSIEGGVYLLKE